ncbi:MAG: helix-turn-helix transcriptional regulator [Halioglobus sp.]
MQIDPTFSALLGDLYQGPLEEQPWHTFLASVREVLGANLVTLLLRPPSKEEQVVMLADGGSLSAIRSYNEGQFVLDPFVNLPTREVVSLHEYLSVETLLDSDFYRVIMEPQGWYDFLGVDIREEAELDVRFRAGRYRGAPPFGEAEKALLQTLLPHLERAIRLHTRINRTERERAVYAGAVEQLLVATIILDEEGRVLSTNTTAAALLAAPNGIVLEGQHLRLADRSADRELRALLAAVTQARRETLPQAARAMQVPRPGAPDLGLVVRAVSPAGGAQGRGIPSIAIFVRDPQQAAEPPQQVISRLYGLTPTEVNLAMLLANGRTLDETAAQLSISRNTARAHLRAVFAKTGVTRQAGLVRLILNSMAPFAGGESPCDPAVRPAAVPGADRLRRGRGAARR